MYKIFDSPKEPTDVVNKQYIDTEIKFLLDKIEFLENIINKPEIKITKIDIIGSEIIEIDSSMINLNKVKIFEFNNDNDISEFIFNHNLNSMNIIHSLYNANTGENVFANFIRLNKNQVKIELNISSEDELKFILIIYNPI